MSRSTANWLFVLPLLVIGILLIHPSITGGTEKVDEPVDLLGLLLALLGLAIRVIARDWKVTHSNGSLVTTGPYAIVRHPMYVGSFLAGFGLSVVLGSAAYLVVFSVVYILVHALVVHREERSMMEKWPEEYVRYRGSVPACFPHPVHLVRSLLIKQPKMSSYKKAVTRELSPICGIISGCLLLEAREDYAVLGWAREQTEITAYLSITLVLVAVWAWHTISHRMKPQDA